MSWFIVDAFSDLDSQYRVAAETIEADASDEALVRMAEKYPKARTFRCLEIRETLAETIAAGRSNYCDARGLEGRHCMKEIHHSGPHYSGLGATGARDRWWAQDFDTRRKK